MKSLVNVRGLKGLKWWNYGFHNIL
jgi:hypothetical protein